MPKVNVYLAEQVKEAGVPVSAACQRALEQAVRRIGTIRAVRLDEPASQDAAARQSKFTDRLRLATDRARADGSAPVGTEHLLGGVLEEGANLALRVLRHHPTSYSPTAAAALELAVTEALTLGHDYVGCEHLLIGLVTDPDGTAGQVLRGLGVDARSARQSVVAALSGLAHLQAATASQPDPTAVITAVVRRELQPLLARIERLEGS